MKMIKNDKNLLLKFWLKNGMIKDARVVEAFKQVPREEFVLQQFKEEAYKDKPLPIGYGQTISQPTTVVLMHDALEVKTICKVLEVGAGSGYQAALLGKLAARGKVYTTEIIPELCEFSRANLKKVRVRNVQVIHADGSQGYKKKAPYDRIIVTAASPQVPLELVQQLKVSGILVIPVGSLYEQRLLKIKKLGKKKFDIKYLGEFVFVPLRGKNGYNF